MAGSVGFAYLEINWEGKQATVRVTDEAFQGWELMSGATSTWWPSGADWRKGRWKATWGQNFEGVECARQNGIPIFGLRDLRFPPELGIPHGFDVLQGWVAPTNENLWHRRGTYEVVVTEQLIEDARREIDDLLRQLYELGIELGIDAAAMIPGPQASVFSMAGAYMASRRGDYLACALSLGGAIPLFGSIMNGTKRLAGVQRLEAAAARLSRLTKALERFTKIGRAGGKTEKILDASLQGTTVVPKAAPIAAQELDLRGGCVQLTKAMLDLKVDFDAVSRTAGAFRGFPRMTGKTIRQFLKVLSEQGFRRVTVGRYDAVGKTANAGGSNIYFRFDRSGKFTGEAIRLDSRGHSMKFTDTSIRTSAGPVRVGWGAVPHFHKEFIHPKNAEQFLRAPLKPGDSLLFDDWGTILNAESMDLRLAFAHCWLVK